VTRSPGNSRLHDLPLNRTFLPEWRVAPAPGPPPISLWSTPSGLSPPTVILISEERSEYTQRVLPISLNDSWFREGFRMPAWCDRSTRGRVGVRRPPKSEPAGSGE
jgi:hypothetical protein